MCCWFLIACSCRSSASCGTLNGLKTRFLDLSSFPWLASVQDYSGSHLAGGAIISEFWIVTAPSALKLRRDLSVVVGISELDLMGSRASYVIHRLIIHEEFDEILHSNDLMLLMTREKIRFGRRVQPICFPSLDPHNSALSNCTVSGRTGWKESGHSGSTSWCRLSVENMNRCPLQRTVSTECCIHRGSGERGCAGTEGSPVSCQVKGEERWLLAGVLPAAGMRSHVPVLYTRTSYYSDWISSRTTQAGRPFIPTVTINTVVEAYDQLHFRSAVKKAQPREEEDEGLLYDYYHGNELPKTCGYSRSPDVHLIAIVLLLTR
ncbi:inactive serine protease 54 [Bufo gargarizans]|uniref:inactive serine protease 54 n=1 Tax=Bufo gargarizans TaxID=30331 RepID=UPI001CF4DC3A|nr:inactive serine protease 54 [Bufo gargarizans]